MKSIRCLINNQVGRNTCVVLPLPEGVFPILFTATVAAVIGHYAPQIFARIANK